MQLHEVSAVVGIDNTFQKLDGLLACLRPAHVVQICLIALPETVTLLTLGVSGLGEEHREVVPSLLPSDIDRTETCLHVGNNCWSIPDSLFGGCFFLVFGV